MNMASCGSPGRFFLAGFFLALSITTVSFCQAFAKVPERKPRQAPEDDGPGSRVQGVWSPWGPWSACSQPCGLGVLERTRACQSPYQRVPWAGRTEMAPQHPAHPQHASHQGERAASPYPARPSYPLHTDRNTRPALSYHGTGAILPLHTRGQPPDAPYGSPNRYARQEAFPVDRSPLTQTRNVLTPQGSRRRDVLPSRSAPAGLRGNPLQREEPPNHTSSHRLPHGSARHGGSTRPAARSSVPLFKPVRRSSHEAGLSPDRPRSRSQADSSQYSWASSPTPESREAWRSRVRESIKPGKYGYGKVPFALPLHKDVATATVSRFKRHHGAQDDAPPPPPPLPPHPPSRKQKRKAVGPSAHEAEASSRDKEPVAQSSPEQPLFTSRAAHGVEHSRQDATRGSLRDTSEPTEPALMMTRSSETSSRTEPRRKAATTPPASPGGAPEPDRTTAPAEKPPPPHKVSARPPVAPGGPPQPEGSPDSSVDSGNEGSDGDVSPAASVVPPSRRPSSPGSPSQVPGELHLTHQVLRNHSSTSKRKGPGVGKTPRVSPGPPQHPEGGPMAHIDGAVRGNPPPPEQGRSRNQRQNVPQTGSHGVWPSHNLFVDQPVAPRLAEPNTWLPPRGNPTQLHGRGYVPHAVGEARQWNLYYPGMETFHCEGVSKQFKACRQEPCPPERPDPRAVQCSAYNNQEFMGRLYQWEPFTDVRGSQRCELNCRPVGYRFYVRHTEKVQDGTPCEASSLDICVAGQCLAPGCDGILGSNRTLDSCGVCGGDHTSCKLVVGNFSDTDVPIGYHRILEIPAGATRIQVKEVTRSPNYLALRSHNGKSIINGNWAVNPPGRYEAAGTVFVYSRPGSDKREGESLTADGPTTEPIDVYMIFQQDNPGVSYQFFLASPQPEGSEHNARGPRQEFGALTLVSPSNHVELPTSHRRPDPRNLIPAHAPVPPSQYGRGQTLAPPPSQSGRSPGILQRNVRVPPLPPPPPPVQHGLETAHDFSWRRIGNTECSASCGKGFWRSVYQCVSRITQEEVAEEKCHLVPKPVTSDEACNTEACPAYWDVGEWSACSKSCGPGTQHRQVLCRQIYANRSTMVHPQRCGQLEKPNATQTCQVHVCSHWEVHTNWSSCSVLCGTGHRTRHVRCVSNHGDLLSDSDCPGNHRPRTSEACDMGPCVRTWFYSDWSSTCSAECGTGIQRRSVVCLSSAANGQVEENCAGTKPADMRACNGGPCQRVVRWYRGPWGQCSADCGTGTQRRDIICVIKLGGEFNVTEASECTHLEKPPSLQPCVGMSCEALWFSTAWSACSRSCVGGIQVREVQCLTQNKTLSNLCPPDQKPAKKRPCNVQPCLPDLDENCRDKYHNCPVIVQARLCVYSYYKAVCCASCTHALERRHVGSSR